MFPALALGEFLGPSSMSEIILYSTAEGTLRIEIHYEDETFWLSQRRIAELFGVTVPTINEHLAKIFATGELDEGCYSEFPNNCHGWGCLFPTLSRFRSYFCMSSTSSRRGG